MRRFFAASLLLLLLLLTPAAAGPHGGKIAWVSDFMTGIESARRQRQVAMVYFSAEWSDECRQLGAGPFSERGVVEAADGVVAVQLDCTDRSAHEVLRQRYGAETLPTVVFVDSDGRKVGTLRSLSDSGAVRDQLRAIAAGQTGSTVAVTGLAAGSAIVGLLCGALALIVGFLRRGVGTGVVGFVAAAGGGALLGAPGAAGGLTLGYLMATAGTPRPGVRKKLAVALVLATSAAVFGYAWLAATHASTLPAALRPPVHPLDTFDSAYARWDELLRAGDADGALEVADAFAQLSPQAGDYADDVDGMRSLARQRGAAEVTRSLGWTLDRAVERLTLHHAAAIGLGLCLLGLALAGSRSKPPSAFGYEQAHESPIGPGGWSGGPRPPLPPTTKFGR